MTQHCVSCRQWCNLALFGSECADHLPTMRCAGMQLSLPLLRVPFVLPFSTPLHHLHHSFLCATLACDLLGGGFHHVEGAYRSRTSLLSLLLGKLLSKCHVALHIRCLEHSLIKNPETSLLSLLLGKLLSKCHVALHTRRLEHSLIKNPNLALLLPELRAITCH